MARFRGNEIQFRYDYAPFHANCLNYGSNPSPNGILRIVIKFHASFTVHIESTHRPHFP